MHRPQGHKVAEQADKLVKRLSSGERAINIAAELGMTHTCFKMNLEPIIGRERWQQIVHPGRYLSDNPAKLQSHMAAEEEASRRMESHKDGMFDDGFECPDCGYDKTNREGPCPKCMTGYVRERKRMRV